MPLEVKKGTELRGRYVISDDIGRGAFAVVWRATDKQAGRDVAIKRLLKLHGNELGRLLDEAKKTSQLKGHKNIVEVYEVFEEDGEGFLVMEYVDGSTLDEIFRQHIRDKTWVDPDEALDYFRQILEGLLFAHSSGLYHRDVKPSNILVSKLGVIKLVDFGLARTMVTNPEEYEHREPGFAWTGTPNFMSPEQARGETLDHQTDIFSAGLVGYILLTGRHPFNHPSAVASVIELIKEPSFDCEDLTPSTTLGIAEGVCKTMMRMLRKDTSQRSRSLIELLTEITKEAAQSCPRCGAPNPMSNSFCGQCGSSLKTPSVGGEGPTGPLTPATEGGAPPRPPGLSPSTAEELTDEGFRLGQAGDWVSAATKYEEAIKRDSSYVRAYANLGYALNRIGRYEEAIEVLSDGIKLTSDKALLHRLYDASGFSRSNLKDYAGAIEDFTKAIQFNPDNPRVYSHRAESKALAGLFNEAYRDVLYALRLDPGFPRAIRLRQKLETQGYVKPLGPGKY